MLAPLDPQRSFSMKRLFLFLLALVLIACLAAPAAARWVCSGNRCYWVPDAAPVAQPAAAQPAPAVKFPQRIPAGPAPEVFAAGKLPTGVNPEMMQPERERYSVAGVEVDQRACYAAIGADGLVDDSKRPICSVIDADEARRKAVVAGLKAGLGDAVKYWDGKPTDWSFRPGFEVKGQPTIYCQAPDGGVLHRQDDLAGGVEAAVEAIRRKLPDYDSSRDPDARKFGIPDLFKFLTGENLTGLVALAGVGLLAFLVLRKDTSP
jgi:hypothetical protein